MTDAAALSALVGIAVDRAGNFLAAARTAVASGRAFKSLNRAEKKRVRAAQQKLVRYAAAGATRITEDSRSLLRTLLRESEKDYLDYLLLPGYARSRLALYRAWMRQEIQGVHLRVRGERSNELQSRSASAVLSGRSLLRGHVAEHSPA